MISRFSMIPSGINVTEATGRSCKGTASARAKAGQRTSKTAPARARVCQRASAPASGVPAPDRAKAGQRATSQGIKTASACKTTTGTTSLTCKAVLLGVVSATLLSLSGCSSDSGGDAAVTVTRSNQGNQAGATAVASQHSFKDCEALVSEVEGLQLAMLTQGEPWDDVKKDFARDVGVGATSMLRGADPATFPIGREAALDPHSNKMKRDVREYCGSNFDAARQKMADGMEKDWKEEGYTPDWEIK